MRNILILALSIVVSILVYFYSDKDKRWLFFNGSDAETYAVQLLNDISIKTPKKFVDYTVSKNEGYVIFSKHGDHLTIYGYFPVITPNNIEELTSKGEWQQLDEKWFVFHL